MNEEYINFKIEMINIEANSLIVRPVSPQFKNPPESYSPVNIAITTLDPNDDLTTQIAQRMAPLVFSILTSEADASSYSNIIEQLSATTYTVPLTSAFPNLQVSPAYPVGYSLSAVEIKADEISANLLQNTITPMVTSTVLQGIEFIN